MIDWQVGEEEGARPDPTRAPRSPSRLPRARWAGLLLLLLLLVALPAVRRELDARAERMRADLVAFVEREERARLFGQVEAIPELIDPTARRQWREAYRDNFAPGPRAEREIAVEESELIDQGALVMLTVGGAREGRYYRLTADGWRRAPLPEALWGAERSVEVEGILLRYRERDRDVAERLAATLPELVERLRAWGATTPIETIVIEPVEFSRSPARRVSRGLRLTSPLLHRAPNPWSAEQSLRIALAEQLFTDVGPRPAVERSLRNAQQLRAAAQTVERMRWALDWDGYELRLAEARRTLGPEWTSPFLVSGARARVAAEFVADYLYLVEGPHALRDILREVERADSWDTLVRDRIGRSLYELESEAFAYATGGISAPALLDPVALEMGETRLAATVIAASEGELLLRAPGLIGETLAESGDLPLLLPDGSQLPASCAAMYAEVTVEGTWKESGRLLTLRSLQTDATRPARPTLHPLPEAAVAYALEVDWGRKRGGSRVTILALAESGRATPWLEGYNLDPLTDEVRLDGRSYMVMRQSAASCSSGWLYLLSPDHGLIAEWPLDREALHGWLVAVPRETRGDVLLFVGTPGGEILHAVVDPAQPPDTLDWQALAGLNTRSYVLGWSDHLDRLIQFDWGESRLQSVDLESQTIYDHPLALPDNPLRQATLTDAGRRLLYVAAGDGRQSGATRLFEIDLVSGDRELRWQVDEGEAIFDYPFEHVEGSRGDRLALAVQRAGTPSAIGRLLYLDLARDESTLVYEGARNTPVGPTVLCADEGILFMVFHPSDNIADVTVASTDLYLWHPEKGARLLYSSDNALVPWSCAP